MDDSATIGTLQAAVDALRAGSDLDAVRAIQAAQDALDAAKAARLAVIEQTAAYEIDGASSVSVWVRNELRLSAKDAKALTRAASTLKQLPAVSEAAQTGRIRLQHVNVFTYGLKHIGYQVITEAQPWLLDVATTCEPAELFKVTKALREAVFPDELDQAWADGMDKADIQVNPVPSGWHVTGFLSTAIGAKFKTVLDSVSKPLDKDDVRTGAERRVDGFDTMLTTVLESGLPSDKGVRPHLSVIVEADTLAAALERQPGFTPAPGTPAQLAGFGSIGPRLLGHLTCTGDLTGILARGHSQILDVGRSHRCATLKQRRAIIARQEGVCAAPGCHNTHLEIHHSIWWSQGGTTDLNLMVGLCTRCHHLIHRELLHVKADGTGGFTFTNKDNRPLLKAYSQRQALHREAWHIRRTARDIQHRRRERLAPLRT